MASELKVNTITEATSGSGITFAKDIIPATPLSHRNMIINGDMRVAQRSTAMLTVSNDSNEGYSTIDRFWTGFNASVSGAVSFGRDTDAPDGFSRSLKMQCSTPNTSLSGTNAVFVGTTIEAQDLQRLGYGSSGAKTSTLSFYAKRAGTDWGKISVSFNKDDSPEEWFVPEATTLTTSWARYSVTIPANTTNAIADDNGQGVKVRFYVAGPTDATYDGATDTAWGTSRKDHHNDVGNLLSDTSNIFYLTGVQWELGSIATPFEHRSYADELARCQRYFQAHQLLGKTIFPYSGSRFFCPVAPFVPMRSRTGLTVSKTNTVARMTTPNVVDYWVHGGADYANGDWFHSLSLNVGGGITDSGFVLDIYVDSDTDSSLTDQEPMLVTLVNNAARNGASSTGGFLHFSSEL